MTVLIPFAGRLAVPWKNGRGSTTEIAIAPPDAGFDDFDWRISMATISEDGPFSIFDGVDRTLALVDGAGMMLDIDEDERVTVSADDPVVTFGGESPVTAALTRGPTTDFNVMTRRGRCHHQFGRRQLTGVSRFAPRGDVSVLFLSEGDSISVSSESERIGMVRLDAVLFDTNTIWTLEAARAVVLIVDIFYNE
jgi:hypothetical protein